MHAESVCLLLQGKYDLSARAGWSLLPQLRDYSLTVYIIREDKVWKQNPKAWFITLYLRFIQMFVVLCTQM